MKNNIQTALTLAAAAFVAMPVVATAQTVGKCMTPRRRIKPRRGGGLAQERALRPRIGNRRAVPKRTVKIAPRKGKPSKRERN